MAGKEVNLTERQRFGSCEESACTVNLDGKCYEGVTPFTSCPNYIPPDEDEESDDALELPDDEDTEDIEPPNPSLETIELYGGSELDYTSALRITLATPTRVVVLAGPNDSGKTTLLASIFEQFLQGPLAGYLFAGCETLPTFDQRCHLSRIDSGRQTEDTERTKSFSEQTMLHLRVRDEALTKPTQDLLLSDIRGELFKEAIKSKAEAQRIKILRRADHLAVLVDGERLTELGSRHQAATAAKMTLRSFIEAEMIGQHTFVDVLFTKDDLVNMADPANDTVDFINVVEDEIKRKHEHQLGRLRFHRIAARAAEGVHTHGLPELFRSWVEEPAYLRGRYNNQAAVQRLVRSQREFDRYAIRHMPERFF